MGDFTIACHACKRLQGVSHLQGIFKDPRGCPGCHSGRQCEHEIQNICPSTFHNGSDLPLGGDSASGGSSR